MQDGNLLKLHIVVRRVETEADGQTPGLRCSVKNIIISGVNSLEHYVLKFARVLNIKFLFSARRIPLPLLGPHTKNSFIKIIISMSLLSLVSFSSSG